MIPKLSAPLVKDIRTGEGILEYALGALAIAAQAVGDLSISKTGTYLAILAISKSVRRGLLKIVALQKGAGIGAPIAPVFAHGVATTAANVGGVLMEIAAAQAQADAAQAKPGAAAHTIVAGLSPTPAPPAAPPPAA